MTELTPVRQREVTWSDPLVGAALAQELSGLEYLRALADGGVPAPPVAALLGMQITAICWTRPWAAPCTPRWNAGRRTRRWS